MSLGQGILLSVVYGAVGMLLLIAGYGLFDLIEKRIDFAKELKEKNVAVGIVIAGFLIAVGVIIASAIS